jgi:hypothetical protein
MTRPPCIDFVLVHDAEQDTPAAAHMRELFEAEIVRDGLLLRRERVDTKTFVLVSCSYQGDFERKHPTNVHRYTVHLVDSKCRPSGSRSKCR